MTGKKSRRDRLKSRPRPHVTFPLRVDDTAEASARLEAAHRTLRQATVAYDQSGHEQAKADGAPDVLAEHERKAAQLSDAEAEVEAAQQALDGCYEWIKVTALKPDDYEDLIGEHPPTEEQKSEGEIWNPDTFKPALIAACSDDDMTADEWASFLAEDCSHAERHAIWLSALTVNEDFRAADSNLPKGLTLTRS